MTEALLNAQELHIMMYVINQERLRGLILMGNNIYFDKVT